MTDLSTLVSKLIEKFSTWLETFVVMLPNIVLAALLITAAHFASRWAQRGVRRLAKKMSDNIPISDLLGTIARVGVMVVAIFIALGLLNLDRTVTSLLAGVGVVGLALGFAFQDIAANFMSGFMMALRRPFVVGDLVDVAGKVGKVKRLTLRATEMETTDGLSVLVPNKEIFQAPIVNYTRTHCRRMDLEVGVSYSDDMDAVRQTVAEATAEIEHRDPDREVEVFFTAFGDSSINLVVRIWLEQSDQLSYVSARSEAMMAIKKAFDRDGISIPFPIQTLDFGANAVGGKGLQSVPLTMVNDSAQAS